MNKLLSFDFWKEFLPKSISVWRYGYTLKDLKKDILSGFTVSIVALPLSMALAIASGTTPDKGLFTAIVAGFIISAIGGSRFQIGGPTGAFVVLVFETIQKHGYEGLAITTIMAGIILVISALLRIGRYIKYIPYPVITGFTSGIALIIFTTQINDIFGFGIKNQPDNFFLKWLVYFKNLGNIHYPTFLIAILTLAIIVAVRKFKPLWPSFLIGMIISTLVCHFLHLDIATIGSKFGDIPSSLPTPSLPQNITIDRIKILFPDACIIAFLAGIESLLSAIVADGMTGSKHRSNCELLAQGIANIIAPIFGGIPATGAIARTATNIKSGARSPFSGMFHALFILLFMMFLAPLAKHIPLAVLGAILVIVAWNMSEINHFRNIMIAPRGDSMVLLATFILTVAIDLTFAIKTGVILSAIVFMHRMSQAIDLKSFITPINKDNVFYQPNFDAYSTLEMPEGVEAFKLRGPLFFGVSAHIVDMINNISHPRTLIIALDDVPFVDISAENSLSILIKKCKEQKINIVISSNTAQVTKSAKKAVVKTGHGSKVTYAKNFDKAIKLAQKL
ncbi:MAG: SulP family inorganic anion transporter [Alphaproteobacteria bacterium]